VLPDASLAEKKGGGVGESGKVFRGGGESVVEKSGVPLKQMLWEGRDCAVGGLVRSHHRGAETA